MTEAATLIEPGTVKMERLLPGPVERAWAYIVESDKRAQWLAGGEFDLRVGGKIELIFNNDTLTEETAPAGTAGGGMKKFEGKITRLEPLRLLAHTWKWGESDSDVVYELEPRGQQALETDGGRLDEGGTGVHGFFLGLG